MILQSAIAMALALAAAAIAVAPLVLQQPFGSQTSAGMWIAHTARQWGTPLTIVLAAGVIAFARSLSKHARWWGKALLVVPVALVVAAVWFARENPFEWWFNPLSNPRFVRISEASFVLPGDLVLAVTVDGDSAAYPIRQMAYHHIVNDRIGRTPVVVTY